MADAPRRRRQAVTVSDVAKHAGVSLGTVSNALNNPDRVSPALLNRVKSAIDELGFVRNSAARSLAAGTSRTIAFVLVDLANSYFVDMARGAEVAVQESDMYLVIANSDIQQAKQRMYMQHFQQEQVAGILLSPVGGHLDGVEEARQNGRDVVLLDEDSSSCCSVTMNNVHAGFLATQHLIGQGCSRIAFVGGPRRITPIADRLRGSERAVAESDGRVGLEYIATDEVQPEQGRSVGQLLSARPSDERPDGIVAATDLLGLGIMQVMADQVGTRFPHDVALVACDDNRAAFDSLVPISAVAQPGYQMGYAAAKLLLEEISSPQTHVHRRTILGPSLSPRESSIGRDDMSLTIPTV